MNLWRTYAQKTHALEVKFFPSIRKVIIDFRKQFIQTYRSNPQQAHGQLQQQIVPEPLTVLIRKIYASAGQMGARMVFDELRKQAQKGFGRNDQWIKDVQDYLRLHMLEFVQDITETMRNDIIKILEQSVANGWSIDRTVQELAQTGLIDSRARVIARTEIVRAANVGHAAGASSLPFEVDKKWVSALDHRTRHSHKLTNGHIVDEQGTFQVPIYKGDKPTGGFDLMQFPGDPTAGASNTINCRCRVTYIPKRDAQGNLIMRRSTTATIIPMRRPQQIPSQQIAATLKDNIVIGVKK
jgi:uncharacterized protein with gpF-like domain